MYWHISEKYALKENILKKIEAAVFALITWIYELKEKSDVDRTSQTVLISVSFSMVRRRDILFIIFQLMLKIALFFADTDAIFSRSAYSGTQENKQFKGYVCKQFKSASSISYSQSCLRNARCTSTNFKEFPTKDGMGTCELNKHEMPLANEDTKIDDQQGVIFSMIMKVMWIS